LSGSGNGKTTGGAYVAFTGKRTQVTKFGLKWRGTSCVSHREEKREEKGTSSLLQPSNTEEETQLAKKLMGVRLGKGK